MKILHGQKWQDGFLDYFRRESEYRIQVLVYRPLASIEGLYVVRPRDVRWLWNYVRKIGVAAVARKVMSRTGERLRNEKFVAAGLGRVLEAPSKYDYRPGQAVAFLAPCHPACVERLVLPAALLAPIDDNGLAALKDGEILILPPQAPADAAAWQFLEGWSPDSGTPLAAERCRAAMAAVGTHLRDTDWSGAKPLPAADAAATERRSDPARRGRSATKRAVLFGYGNYAKTVVLANLPPGIVLDCVHEIDPTQIPPAPAAARLAGTWDTAPAPRDQDDHDLFLIAGYHHAHAPIAVTALERSAYAVVEKPLVVDDAQLDAVLSALGRNPGRLFACFQKRYSPLNELALRDMAVGPGDPISYHCIVYEIPLPARHWYRWPASGGRLVSNGCHWLDHFLFLNGFAEPAALELAVAGDHTVNCTVQLENGAAFTMVLTDAGSPRIGMQEHVELRGNGRTVTIVNNASYRAEGHGGVIRRTRVNKMESYRHMYRTICKAIVDGRSGDSLRSVEVSSRLMLALDSRFRAAAEDTVDPSTGG